MVNDAWYRWEREAAIHLLFPTLDGSIEPLKQYVGFGFPTTILIFKNGVVTWCLKEQDFLDLGERLREVFSIKRREQRFVKDLRNSIKVLTRAEKTVDLQNLTTLSDKDLVKTYKKLYQAFLKFYAIGAISTPLAFETENFLKQNTDLSDETFNLLTRPKKDSYAKEADKFLLQTKNTRGFIRKFYWIDNNYSYTKVLTEREVVERLKNLEAHKPNRRHLPIIKFSAKTERLIELLRNYALYKDNRKKHILIYLHYLTTFLTEVGKRTNLSLEEMKNTFPFEISLVLSGKLTKQKIEQRKKYCVVVWEEGKGKPLILTGYKGRQWERKTLEKHQDNKLVIGRPACAGKVIAKVRVLMSARECGKLKKGEVLVTFMTSPDFMPAIRKCSAIVTNMGGATSHAAVISRELNIPCIVGTKVGTYILKTGDIVEVDADKGIVTVQ